MAVWPDSVVAGRALPMSQEPSQYATQQQFPFAWCRGETAK
jgi:hypothetical protein